MHPGSLTIVGLFCDVHMAIMNICIKYDQNPSKHVQNMEQTWRFDEILSKYNLWPLRITLTLNPHGQMFQSSHLLITCTLYYLYYQILLRHLSDMEWTWRLDEIVYMTFALSVWPWTSISKYFALRIVLSWTFILNKSPRGVQTLGCFCTISLKVKVIQRSRSNVVTWIASPARNNVCKYEVNW